MAKAAKVTIVEAENILEIGEIDPNDVDLPGIYVDRVVPATVEKQIEVLRLRDPEAEAKNDQLAPNAAQEKRNRIGRRASEELKQGYYVNLGVGALFLRPPRPLIARQLTKRYAAGIPTLAASFIPAGRTVWIQSENGILGMGAYPTKDEVDADIVNAGKETVTLVPGAACFDSSESFGMIRGGHVDVSILGVCFPFQTPFVPYAASV
jgi:3-oxoacid CoA-transferase